MVATRLAIPVYELYGEAHTGTLSGSMHIEAIHARAHVHEWTILAHRHTTLAQIFHIAAGGGAVEIDGSTHRLDAPCLIWLPAGCVHGFRFAPGTDGAVVTVALDVLAASLQCAPDLASGLELPVVGRVPDTAEASIAAALAGLTRESRSTAPGGSAAMVLHLALLLIELLRAAAPERAARRSAARQITDGFRQLVEQHFREGRSMSDYARMLGISADRLHGAIKSASGQTPGAIIHERLMTEARRALIYTAAPVADIAFDLGFEDAAYFSRFFAQRAGMPPTRFRAARDNG